MYSFTKYITEENRITKTGGEREEGKKEGRQGEREREGGKETIAFPCSYIYVVPIMQA